MDHLRCLASFKHNNWHSLLNTRDQIEIKWKPWICTARAGQSQCRNCEKKVKLVSVIDHQLKQAAFTLKQPRLETYWDRVMYWKWLIQFIKHVEMLKYPQWRPLHKYSNKVYWTSSRALTRFLFEVCNKCNSRIHFSFFNCSIL